MAINKLTSLFYAASLSLAVVSCADDVRKGTVDATAPVFGHAIVAQAHDSVFIDEVFNLYNWSVSSSRIYTHQVGGNNLINVYSLPQGQPIFGGVAVGHGPGEFIVTNAGNAAREGDMLIYDIMSKRVSLFDLSADELPVPLEYSLFTDPNGLAYPYTYISQVSDTLFVMKADMYDKSLWQLVDLKNQKVLWESPNSIRNPEESYTPYDFIQVTDDTTLVAAYYFVPLVQIYRMSDKGLRNVVNYGNTKGMAKVKDYDELTYRYISAAIADGILYCLISADGDEHGNVVEVYDLRTLKPLHTIELDRDVVSIRYDNNGNIVGYSPDNNGARFYMWAV